VKAALADRRPLRIPAYRRWWAASLVTAIGGSFSVVAVPVQLYATTGSSAAIGGAAVASFAGLLTGALGAGTLADRRVPPATAAARRTTAGREPGYAGPTARTLTLGLHRADARGSGGSGGQGRGRAAGDVRRPAGG
jgi:hypothetical protein